MKHLICLFLTLALALVSMIPSSGAATYDWDGATPHHWDDTVNWTPAPGLGGPGAPDDAVFPAALPAGKNLLNLNTASRSIKSLSFAMNGTDFFIAGQGGVGAASPQLTVGTHINQHSGRKVVINPDVICGTPFTLGGTGDGTVDFNGSFLGSPDLIVNGPGLHQFRLGASTAPLHFNSIILNGSTLEIGMSNTVHVAGIVQIDAGATLRLCYPGFSAATFNAAQVVVGGTLFGNTTINAPVTVAGGAVIAAGCSPGTLSIIGNLTLSGTSVLNYELDTPGVVGGGVNDLIDVTGDLVLDGILEVTALGGFAPGIYRLFNYTGLLTDNGLALGALPSGYSYTISTATAGEVNLIVTTAATPVSLVSTGTVWAYLDDGSDQGTAWSAPGFNDSGWSNGVCLFGEEDPGIYPDPIRTPWPVGGGRITYYLRTHFNWSGGTAGAVLNASAYIDDGAVFHLNGVEAARVRLTSNPVLFDSLALNQEAEGTADVFTLSSANLVPGDNVLAVEVHQFTPASSDVVFCMTLRRSPPDQVITLTARPGFNLMANPLNGTNNLLETILPNVPEESQVLKWNPVLQEFETSISDGMGWVDVSTGDPATTTVDPGEGFFFFNPGAADLALTFRGQPAAPSLPAPIVRGGYALLSRRDLGPGTFASIVGLPPEAGCQFITFNAASQNFFPTNGMDGEAWLLGQPVTAIGESAFVYFPAGSPPVITQQPVSLNVMQGLTATFTVTAFNQPGLRVLNGVTREGPSGPPPGGFLPAAEGDPVPDIDVKLGKNPGGLLVAQTSSGADGTFALPGLRAGSYLLTTTSTGAVAACVTLAAADPASVQVQGMGLLCGPVPIEVQPELNPPTYQWMRDGVPVPGATTDVLSIDNVQSADSGTFSVVVSNPGGSVTSQEVTLAFVPDTFPPTLVSATADCASNKVTLVFSERLDAMTAEESFNYLISDGVNILSAMLAPDGRTVCLFVDALTNGISYTLTVDNVTDLAGNAIAPGSQINFACPLPVRLFINEWLAEALDDCCDPVDGQHDDWFEIYNPGSNAVNLAGFYLTDWSSNDFRFAIPSGYSVPAGGFLRVYADNQPEQNTGLFPDLHVNFTLPVGGGNIGLYAPDGMVIDAIVYGPQTTDVSEGRFPDGGTPRYFMRCPTPRAPNKLSQAITLARGFTIIGNPLDSGSNTLREVLPVVPDGTRLHKFNNASQTYQTARFSLGFWDDAEIPLHPGEGAWLESPTNFTVVFCGTPRLPVLPIQIPPGQCYLLSQQTPTAGTWESIIGTPPEDGATVYRWEAATQQFRIATYVFGFWDNEPSIGIAEAAWFCPGGGGPPLPSAPVITQQPQNQTVPAGQAATFSVAATGGSPLSYQWIFCPQPNWNLPTNVVGTESVLTISNTQPANAGSYFVIVSNSFGVVTSAVAVLNVSPGLAPCCAGPCPNLVVNGSFEQTSPPMAPNQFHWFGPPTDPTGIVPGWNTTPVNSRQEIEIWCNNAGIPASDGTNHLEINAQLHNQTVFQTVTVTPGYPVTLCFNYTGRYGVVGGSYNNDFDLILSGGHSSTTFLNPPTFSIGGWQQYTTTFVPSGSSVTIAFRGRPHYNDGTIFTQGGAHIDRVCMTQETPPPTLVCAPDKIVECGSNWFFDAPTATGSGLILSMQPPSVHGTPCSQTNTAVFVATDWCGRTVTCTQTVVVVDTTPPVILCTVQSIPCGTPLTFTPPFAYDPVCSNSVTVTAVSTVTNGTCPMFVERAWRATDACGNSTICTQYVAIVDFTPPVFTTQCTMNYYEAGGTTDNFNGAQPTSPSPGLVARLQSLGAVFKGFDDCTTERFVAHTFTGLPPCITAATLTVRLRTCGTILCGNDTFGFSFTGPNGQLVPGSGTWSRSLGSLVAGDWCDYTSGQIFAFDLAALPAGGGATDLIASLNQTGFLDVTLQDDSAVDYITLEVVSCCCGTTRTVECGTDWTFTTPTATDNCCTNVSIAPLSTVTNVFGDCRQTITRTWQASDCCSNTAVCVEVVNVVDTTPPVLTGTCMTNVFQASVASPSQGVQARLAAGGVTCLKGLDDCDLDCFFAHTFANLPSSITSAKLTVRLRPCGGDGWTDTLGLYFHNGAGSSMAGGWSRLIGTGAGSPPDLLQFDWDTYSDHTFTFDLGNMPLGGANLLPYLNQYGFLDFIVQDDTAVESLSLEVVSCGCDSTKIVECGTPWSFETPTAFDACCGTNVTLTSVVFGSGNACSNVNTMIWTATDCCSNSVTCTQRVVVVDTTAPVVTCPANKTVECGSGWTFDRPTAYDACSGTNVSIQPILPPVGGAGSCPWTITQTWFVTDNCGNSATCTQMVTVVDTTPPVLRCPEIIRVPTCSTSRVVRFQVSATDACDQNVQVTCVPPSGFDFSLGVTPVVCTATDDCGNTSTCTFPVVVYSGNSFWQLFPSGQIDCNAWPNETAFRGPCLNSAYPTALWKNFDDPQHNRFFGRTWSLPPFSTYLDGWLVTRMKDYNCRGISDNDTIQLGLQNCGSPSWAWGRPLGNLGTDLGLPSTDPWCNISNCGPVFNLHLSDLPPLGNNNSVMGAINAPAGAPPWARRLDMFVQDDTRVDYANLWLRRCPPQNIIGGIGVNVTNASVVHGRRYFSNNVSPGLAWTLSKDPASTNGFSATFDLGAATAGRLNFQNLRFNEGSGGMKRSIDIGGYDPDECPMCPQYRLHWWSSNDVVRLQLNQPIPGVSNVIVRTFSNGVVVASNTLPATAGVELASFPSTADVLSISVGKNGGMSCRILDVWESQFIVTPQQAITPDFADVQSLTLTAEGFEQITLGQPEVRMDVCCDPIDGQHDDIVDPADGQHDDWLATVSGDALARVENGQLTLSALDAGSLQPMVLNVSLCCAGEGDSDGPPTNEFRATIATTFGQFSPMPSNSSLRVACIVDPTDGQHDDWFSVSYTYGGGGGNGGGGSGWALTATRTNASLPIRRVEVWDSNDVLVANVPNPASVSVSELPRVYWPSTTWFVDDDICHRFPYDSAVTVWINDTEYQGTDLRVLTDGPGNGRLFQGLRVETVGAEALVLAGLELGLARYALERPVLEGGAITFSWGGPGQSGLESAPTLNGPWTPMPVPDGERRVTVPTTGPSRFFRARGN